VGRPVILAALLLVLAAALGAAAIILPGRGGEDHARSQAQAETAVQEIVNAQIALHAQTGAFQPFTAAEQGADRSLLGLPWRGFPVGSYGFEAEALPTGNLRVRAVPHPESVAAREAAGRFYVAEVSPDGGIVESGWLPAQ
jgi:hypothetical protein